MNPREARLALEWCARNAIELATANKTDVLTTKIKEYGDQILATIIPSLLMYMGDGLITGERMAQVHYDKAELRIALDYDGRVKFSTNGLPDRDGRVEIWPPKDDEAKH